MPKIKDFEKEKKVKAKAPEVASEELQASPASSKRRRPGREVEESVEEVKVVIVEASEELPPEASTDTVPQNQSVEKEEPMVANPRVEIKFPGSEILRAQFSKPFQVAETIATDWMNDGKFEDLELGHPLAEYFVAKGLQKAKDVEKKVLESPLTEKVAMQVLQAGMKAQEIVTQVRSKLKN